MAIVDKLKANIKAAGGDTSGIRNIEDAVAKMGVSSGGGGGGGAVVVPLVIGQDDSITIPVKASELFESCSTKSVIARVDANGHVVNSPIILSQRIEDEPGVFEYAFTLFAGNLSDDSLARLEATGDNHPYKGPNK
jgi:hypothetical protein